MLQKADEQGTPPHRGRTAAAAMEVLGKAPTPKGAFLPQRIVSYKYLSVQLHS